MKVKSISFEDVCGVLHIVVEDFHKVRTTYTGCVITSWNGDGSMKEILDMHSNPIDSEIVEMMMNDER